LRKRLLAASVRMITFESPFPSAHSGTLANRGECLSALSRAGYPRAKGERAAFWRAMLAHAELWSGEARRRGRDDVVGRLEKLRARSAAALGCILEDLEESRDLDGENCSGEGRGLPNGDRYS
jgi:hypothetical protein